MLNDTPATGQPVDGDILVNTATLTERIGTPAQDALTDTAQIEIAEPNITTVKRARDRPRTGGASDHGDDHPAGDGRLHRHRLQLTVQNTGDWTAYDVDVFDQPDTVATTDCSDTPRLTVAADQPPLPVGVVAAPGEPIARSRRTRASDRRVRVPAPGRSVTISYTLQIPPDLPASALITGPEFVNAATVPTYFALPPAERLDNPDVHTYGPVEATGHVNVAGKTEIGDHVWFDVDGDGLEDVLEPGIPGVGLSGCVSGEGPTASSTTTPAP